MSENTSTEGRLLRTRKVRRAQSDRLPFVPYGGAPIIALGLLMAFALWPFAFGVIQLSTERAAAQALADIDAAWARPRVSGQWVTLEGRPPSRQAAEGALAAVREARASTLLGMARPVTRVRDGFDWAGLGETASASSINWSFRVANGVLTLDGDMPNNTVREQVVAAAIAELPGEPAYEDDDEDYESGKNAAEARAETGFMSRLFNTRRRN